MPELTRVRDDVDGVAGDAKEDDEGGIVARVEGLVLEDDTPLIATIVPEKPIGSISGVDLLVLLCQAKDDIRRLEKENKDLKRQDEAAAD